ncbi:MAG: SRPBCC family protein [Burkholderiaceae bacterium]
MKFEHFVTINDPLNAIAARLTRTQVWQGLVLRAESPELFISYLDTCEILSRSPEHAERILHYGEVAIRDNVRYSPQRELRYEVPAQTGIKASLLLVTIEEPVAGLMFVRFSYDDGVLEEAGSMDAFYNEFKRSAYEEADIDTIRIIRLMAQEGRLG